MVSKKMFHMWNVGGSKVNKTPNFLLYLVYAVATGKCDDNVVIDFFLQKSIL